jgi:hypothetical protein
MPTYEVKVGSSTYQVDAPDENTAWKWANYTHNQSATQAAPVAPAPTESGGFFGSFGSALKERATTALPTAKIFTGLGDQKAAVDELAKHKEEANNAYKDTEFSEIGDAFKQGNFTQALGKTVDKFKEVAGSSLGTMAPAMGAGAAAAAAAGTVAGGAALAAVGIPAAVAGTAAFGLTALGSYLSDNISRQKEEQAAAGKPYEDINRLKGVTAAAVSTSLDIFGFKFFKPLGRLVGIEGKAAAEKTAMEIVAKATQPKAYARAVARGTAEGIAFEIPQEVTQQVMERWQAGLALDPFTDPSAAKEYLEAAGGALLLGGPMGAYSKLRDTAAARGTPEGQALLRKDVTGASRDVEREPDVTEPVSTPNRAGATVAGQPDTGAPAAGTAGTQRTGVDVSRQNAPGTTGGEAGQPGALDSTTPPPPPSLTDEEIQAASADAKEAYDDARDHLSALLKLPSRTESQDNMLGRLRTELVQADYQRYLKDTVDDKPLADVVDEIVVKIGPGKKAPRAMQRETTGTPWEGVTRTTRGDAEMVATSLLNDVGQRNKADTNTPEYAALKASIAKTGIVDPITITTNSLGKPEVFEGNHRLQAARELGIKEIPVVLHSRINQSESRPVVGIKPSSLLTKAPRAMQGEMFSTNEQIGRAITGAMALAGQDPVKAAQELENRKQRVADYEHSDAEVMRLGRSADMNAAQAMANRDALVAEAKKRTLETIDQAIAGLPSVGQPRAMQGDLFGSASQRATEKPTEKSAELENTLTALLLGEDPRKDFGAEEVGAKPEAETTEQKPVSQKETETAPSISTEHINATNEGTLVNRFFDALVSSTDSPGEVDKHTALKNVVRKDVLNYDIAKPGATKSSGLREALDYIGSLVGGRDKLNAMIDQLEQNKSPSVQQAIFNRFGLPNLTSRRGLEGFASRVGKELDELPIMRKQAGDERTGVQISTKNMPAPATGEFKGVAPYESKVEATPIKTKERGTNSEGKPRRPSLDDQEKKRFVVQDTKLRTAWRAIKQLIAARGAPSAEQLAAKNYMENPGRETFGDALNDLAYDIATDEAANSTFYGEGGKYAAAFQKWINDNLDQSTIGVLNDLIAIHKLNVAETEKYNAAISKYNEALDGFAEKKRVAAEVTAKKKLEKTPSKRPNISERIKETEAGEQEDAPAEKLKHSLGTMHPAVLRMVEKGDLTGALETLADAEKGYYKVLAERLLAAKPTAKLEIINRNKILSLSNDPNVKETLKNQIAMLVKMVETSIPEERQGVMVRNLKSDNLQAVMTEVKNLQKNFTNASQQEIAKQAYDLLNREYGWIGKYDPESDTIMLRDTTISNHTFLHEVLHAITSDLIENADKLRGVRKDAYNRLEELYKYASGILAAQNSGTTAYGVQDLHEFISEAMTNPEFQADLRVLRYKAAPFSLWDAFSRAIAQLFRMDAKSKDSNVMVEVMRATNILIPGEASLESAETSKFLDANIDDKGAYIPSTKKGEDPIATAGFKTLRAGNDYSEKLTGAIFITGMNVADRNKGAGTKLLQAITRWADANKKTLVLSAIASPDSLLGGLSQEQLKGWYARNGFEDRTDIMVRTPSKEARKLKPKAIPGRIAAVPAGMQNTPSTLKQLQKSRTWEEAQKPFEQIIVSAKAASRPQLLGALTLRQIGDLVRNRVPQVNNFIRLTEEFLARKNNILKESGDILKLWERMQSSDPAESKALAKVMHEATILQFDPDKIRYGRNPREIMVADAWKELSLTSKNIYRRVRDFYEHRQAEYKGIMAKRIIEMRNLGVSEATILEIRNEFENTKFRGPYFPLMRHGRFWYQIGTGKDREYYMFETAGAKEAHMAERISQDPNLPVREGSEYAQQMDLHAKQSNFLRTVFSAIDGVSNTTFAGLPAQNLKDTIYQNFLAIQPESSFRTQFMHRNNVAGYSEDALRNFAKSSFHMAYQLARFEHSPDMFSQVQAARMQIKDRKDADGKFDKELSRENNELSDYVTEMDKRLKLMLNPTDVGTIPSLLSNIGFIWYLTAPASAIVNIVGGMVIGLPTLIGQNVRMNPGKSYTKATLEALGQMKTVAGQIIATGFEVETGKRIRDYRVQFPTLSRSDSMTDVDKQAYERFVADGVIDITAAYDQSGLASAPTDSYGGVKNRAMEAMSSLFHNAERFNREVMAMSSFRAAMEKRKGYADQNLAFAEAVADAKDVTQRSMFDYSSANKPRYFQNPVARVVLQFKQFPQQMTFFLAHNAVNMFKGMDAPTRREARARFVGTMGMAAILSGGTGIWGFSTVAAIINAVVNGLKDDDDEEMFDFELEFVNWAVETFGANMGTLITRGAGNALTGLDVASRVKLDDMWFRDSRKNQDEVQALQTFLVDLLGPTAGLAVNVAEAHKLWNEGHGDRALEMIAPAFIKNPLVAARYATEGVNTLSGDPLMEDVSPFHLMAQSLGLRSAELSEIQFYNTNIKGQEQAILKQRQNLLNLYALAFMSNDADTLDTAYDNIDKFNSKHPSVLIAAGTLTKSIKGHLEKSTQMDHGLYLDKKLRGVLDSHDYIDKIRQ